ncbi:hypothetical protein [Thermobrachium celere]|uniref:Uncharacterized protein n=1 Tax=Thermobrachium celere DSM 8682 TaxID=941824 RepID=R7RSR6_9CLOT|nr:hypothetical protein [Thermobrachium celere]CDF58300.1 hypothetical protein TCEL_00346 [Thermobrachium celere DSM 8682]
MQFKFINNTTNEKFYIFELMHEDREGNITNFPLVVRENLAIEIIKKIFNNPDTNFKVAGEIKNVRSIDIEGGTYIKAKEIIEVEKDEKENKFFVDAYVIKNTKKFDKFSYTIYSIVANKIILNQQEKVLKPTYLFLKVNNFTREFIKEDRIQFHAKLIKYFNIIELETDEKNIFSFSNELFRPFINCSHKKFVINS